MSRDMNFQRFRDLCDLIIRRARKVSTDRMDHIRTNSLNKNIAGRDSSTSLQQ